MAKYTKRKIFDHIHHLFALQLRRAGQMQLKCILRGVEIRLIVPCCILSTNLIIVDYTKKPDTLPLRTVIHYGVNENWDTLNAVNITI
jgi:hypothetical protein